ncbi:MAG: hypothetical protein JWO40_8 [Candidatus Doudnabacteria bacterium]|nr:hypothetical protein [Candidatus Doudnabacteria bacterium]
MHKFIKSTVFSGALLSVMFTPALSYAAEPNHQGSKSACISLEMNTTKTKERLVQIKPPVAPNPGDLQRVKGISTAKNNELPVNVSVFEKNAVTPEQKKALTDFRTAIHTLNEAKSAAIRKANSDFVAASQQLAAATKVSNQTATDLFKAAIQAAALKAKTDCAAGIDPKTVKATFNKTVADAQKTLKTTAQTNANHQDTSAAMQTLIKIRNDAAKKAQTDFDLAAQIAATALKAAFPNISTTEATAKPVVVKTVKPTLPKPEVKHLPAVINGDQIKK